jgi:hypothetical protein
VLWDCYESVIGLLRECYWSVTRVLLECNESVIGSLRECYESDDSLPAFQQYSIESPK